MNTKKIKSKIILGLLVFAVFGLGATYVFAQWSGPPGPPPGGDIEPPINTGDILQEKSGGLTVGTGLDWTQTGFVIYKGKMGIGALEPAANLHINQFNYAGIQLGNNTAGEGMHITKTSNDNSLRFWGGVVGAGTRLMTLYQNALLELEGQLKIKGGTPGAGKVLTSDANGLATWQTVSGGGLPSGNSGQTLRNDGTNWIANSNIYNDGTNVGIGVTNPLTKLHVNGDINVSSATGVYKWGNIAGTQNVTCDSDQVFKGVNIRGGIITGGSCADDNIGGSGGLSGSGTTNFIPKWTNSSTLGNSIISQSGSNINLAGNLNLSTSEGMSLIERSAGALSIRAQSTGSTPGSIDFRTDGVARMTIHEPNLTYNYLDGTVDIAKLRVQGAGAAGRVLSSVNSQGLVQWSTLSSIAVTSITAGAGISVSGSTGNVTVSAIQGSWCGFNLTETNGTFDTPGPNPHNIRPCKGFTPSVQCPPDYTRENIHRIDTSYSQAWTCIKN